jgi:hypothetical protein
LIEAHFTDPGGFTNTSGMDNIGMDKEYDAFDGGDANADIDIDIKMDGDADFDSMEMDNDNMDEDMDDKGNMDKEGFDD